MSAGRTFRFCATALMLAVLVAWALEGCATNTGDAGKDARGRATNQALLEAGTVLGKVAVSALFNIATQEATAGKVDYQHAAVQGLYANVDGAQTAAAVQRIVAAYSAGNTPRTAAAAATAFRQADPNADAATVNSAIAAVISTAAGAPPAR